MDKASTSYTTHTRNVTAEKSKCEAHIIHYNTVTEEECSIKDLELAFGIGGIEASAIDDGIRCETQEHRISSGMKRTGQLTATKPCKHWRYVCLTWVTKQKSILVCLSLILIPRLIKNGYELSIELESHHL